MDIFIYYLLHFDSKGKRRPQLVSYLFHFLRAGQVRSGFFYKQKMLICNLSFIVNNLPEKQQTGSFSLLESNYCLFNDTKGSAP